MVATQAAATAALAVAANKTANLIPALNADPRIDAAIKAGIALIAILASVKLDGYAKVVLIATGVGVGWAAVAPYIAGLRA